MKYSGLENDSWILNWHEEMRYLICGAAGKVKRQNGNFITRFEKDRFRGGKCLKKQEKS